MTDEAIGSPPHLHDGATVSGIMGRVSLALLPGIFCHGYFFGPGIVIQCLLCIIYALFLESLLLCIARKRVGIFLRDGSAVVTGLLFALCLSPFTPWWISLIGMTFAMVFGKHLYGGLGLNPFNPAMAGYVFILLSYPAEMNLWPSIPAPGLADTLSIILWQDFPPVYTIDGLSGASALNELKSRLGEMAMLSEIRHGPLFGSLAGRGVEWVNAAYAVGGLYLLYARVISWRIPLGVLGGLVLASTLFAVLDSELYASPLFHLFAGGTLLGAFFIATDPVTGPETQAGCLIYGLLIGLLAFLIRTFGTYPDGFAFAILIGNAAAPLITRLSLPRITGGTT